MNISGDNRDYFHTIGVMLFIADRQIQSSHIPLPPFGLFSAPCDAKAYEAYNRACGDPSPTRDKLAGPKLLVSVVERGKCYLIYQLTITITVYISVDNSNCPYTGKLLK